LCFVPAKTMTPLRIGLCRAGILFCRAIISLIVLETIDFYCLHLFPVAA
jgi:hypothetical protein